MGTLNPKEFAGDMDKDSEVDLTTRMDKADLRPIKRFFVAPFDVCTRSVLLSDPADRQGSRSFPP